MDAVQGEYPPPHVVRASDRELTVEDAGPADGFPVLVLRGGSRHLFPPAVAEARQAGLRLIGYNRPGAGGSTAMPGRDFADCAVDISAVLTDMGISRAAVSGTSIGGPHALAAAALLPDLIAAVCVFAPLAPYDAPGLDFADGMAMAEGMREDARIFFEDPKRSREEFHAYAAEAASSQSSPGWWLERWGDLAGKDAAHSQAWAEYLAACARDEYAQGDQAWWDDWSAGFRPWRFDLAAIEAPVSMWHGLADTAVPPAHSRWLAARIPHAVAHFPSGQDHTNVEENNRAAAFAWLREQAC